MIPITLNLFIQRWNHYFNIDRQHSYSEMLTFFCFKINLLFYSHQNLRKVEIGTDILKIEVICSTFTNRRQLKRQMLKPVYTIRFLDSILLYNFRVWRLTCDSYNIKFVYSTLQYCCVLSLFISYILQESFLLL